MKEFYIANDDGDKGPYALSQLRKMWDSGIITMDTLYWHEGMPTWGKVSDLMGGDETESEVDTQLPTQTGWQPPPVPTQITPHLPPVPVQTGWQPPPVPTLPREQTLSGPVVTEKTPLKISQIPRQRGAGLLLRDIIKSTTNDPLGLRLPLRTDTDEEKTPIPPKQQNGFTVFFARLFATILTFAILGFILGGILGGTLSLIGSAAARGTSFFYGAVSGMLMWTITKGMPLGPLTAFVSLYRLKKYPNKYQMGDHVLISGIIGAIYTFFILLLLLWHR